MTAPKLVARTPDASPDFFTASDVARFCQVDLKTIHNWAERGDVRHFRTPGRHLRFRRADVLDFLRRYGYPIPDELRATKPRVFLADPDPAVLATLRRALRGGFDVATFQDVFDALVAAGKLEPDALVFDPAIEGTGGLAIVERLAASAPTSHVRAVVYSANDDLRRAAPRAGAFGAVKKGAPDELADTLARLLGVER